MITEMPEIQPVDKIAVDRNEEAALTQQPSYAATKPDLATAAFRRRQILSQIPQDTWSLLSPEKRSSRRRC
jgi:hypothetical protein